MSFCLHDNPEAGKLLFCLIFQMKKLRLGECMRLPEAGHLVISTVRTRPGLGPQLWASEASRLVRLLGGLSAECSPVLPAHLQRRGVLYPSLGPSMRSNCGHISLSQDIHLLSPHLPWEAPEVDKPSPRTPGRGEHLPEIGQRPRRRGETQKGKP